MRLSDILDTTIARLKSRFPAIEKVYDEEVKQGLKLPCFFVYIVPIVDSNETQNRRYRRVTVKIVYMAHRLTNTEYLSMTDDLNDAFGMNFPVGTRVLSIFDKTSQKIDDALHFSFDVSTYSLVFDHQNELEQYEMMGELHLNLQKEG